MILDDHLLEPIHRTLVVPRVYRQEVLQSPRRDAGMIRHRLHTLTLQVRDLTRNVSLQVTTTLTARKTISKSTEKTSHISTQPTDPLSIHAMTSF
jgi:hypothetical protein